MLNDTYNVGVNDANIDLFEGQYTVPNGMAYNSYVIKDEKCAVFDSVSLSFRDEWLTNISAALAPRQPDYLVVQHMEPDHSANIASFMEKYPRAIIVASKQAFAMMRSFFGRDWNSRALTVGEGSTLNLGHHVIRFFTAPMVHWPEVVVSYDTTEKTLFSADAFGKFGVREASEDWASEARRYYFGIVGRFGLQTQALLKKLSALEISAICPLHGPVLTDNLPRHIGLYNVWSSYRPESKGIFIAYTSVYGHTEKAVLDFARQLRERGVTEVIVSDLAREDMSNAIANAFRYEKLVLATTTYNSGIFPPMRTFIEELLERNFQNRTVAFIENGSWAPSAARNMRKMLECSKNIAFAQNEVHIASVLSDASRTELLSLAEELTTCGGTV